MFDKIAINNTFPRSPYFALLAENLVLIPLLIPVLYLRKVKLDSLRSLSGWKIPVILSGLYAIANLTNFSAISVGYVGYVAAIRELSSLAAVVGGYYLLKESGLARRFISALVMGAGVFLIGYLG